MSHIKGFPQGLLGCLRHRSITSLNMKTHFHRNILTLILSNLLASYRVADNEKSAKEEGRGKSYRKEKKKRLKSKERWAHKNEREREREPEETGKKMVKRTNARGRVFIWLSHRGTGWEAVIRKTNHIIRWVHSEISTGTNSACKVLYSWISDMSELLALSIQDKDVSND